MMTRFYQDSPRSLFLNYGWCGKSRFADISVNNVLFNKIFLLPYSLD